LYSSMTYNWSKNKNAMPEST